MQCETKLFLDMAEKAGRLFVWDIESTGLNCDYNSVLVVSVLPFGGKPVTFKVAQPGNDKKVVREAAEYLGTAAAWVTFYGKGFDVPMMNGRLLKWGLPPLPKIHHADVFFQLVGKINTSRKSQAHIARWLGLPEKKMDVAPGEWNSVLHDPAAMRVLVKRCESDVECLTQAYVRTRHIFGELTR